MKRAKKSQPLLPTNSTMAHEGLKDTVLDPGYRTLLRVLADVVDTAIEGTDCYLQLGLNKSHDAVVLKVVVEGEPMYISGLTLLDVGRLAESLL